LKKIGIFTSGKSDWNVHQLEEEIKKKGINCVTFPLSELVARLEGKPRVSCRGYDLEEFDALIVRWVPKGSAEQLIFRMDALHRLENLGVRVMNPPIAIERCADKFYTSSLLEDAGIPTLPTVVTEKRGEAMKAFEEFGDVIVKPLFGSLGAGMLRITDRDLAYRTFSALEFGRYVYYIQKFIPHHNRDIRALVIGNEVLAAMRIGEGWKTNVSAGARVEPYELSDELKEVALKSAEILKCGYAGVDIIKNGDKFYVAEINAIPGWKGLQSVTGVNIAEKIIDHLFGR
jgi:RimK family alpha-L-glutamate ligase